MYAFITLDNYVGELYEAMPAPDTYAPWYMERIMLLPEGVTSGYIYDPDTGEFSPPPPPPAPEPGVSELIDILLGVKEI